jgi:NADH-quinone oxidoreductase subunit C
VKCRHRPPAEERRRHRPTIIAPSRVAAGSGVDEPAIDCLTLIVQRDQLLAVLAALRDDQALAFGHLSDVTAVDYLDLGRETRFDVVYHLLSRPLRRRLRLRVPLDEDDPSVPTAATLYPTANWLEREVNDMFGIGFTGHPDPRRILLPDDFEGHPLRKDFPIGAERSPQPTRTDLPGLPESDRGTSLSSGEGPGGGASDGRTC